jgi:hypothetical protein
MKEQVKKFFIATLTYFGLAPKQTEAQRSAESRNAISPRVAREPDTQTQLLRREPKIWNPPAARSLEELAYTVRNITTGVRMQSASPAVKEHARQDVQSRLSMVHASLYRIPAALFFPDSPGMSELDAATRIERAGVRAVPKLPDAGKTPLQVANALYGFGAALKTQVIASPALSFPEMLHLREELSAQADRLVALSGDVCISRTNKRSRSR